MQANKTLDQLLEYNQSTDHFYKDLSEIRPNIFLGSLSGLNNLNHVKHLGITHCVNCTGDVPFPNHSQFPQQNLHRFNIAQERSQMYLNKKDEKIEKFALVKQMLIFVQKAIESGGKVAFYCIAGCHRAPGTCQLYLMFEAATRGETIEPVVAFVETQTKRIQAEFCYESLLLSLKTYLNNNAQMIVNLAKRQISITK